MTFDESQWPAGTAQVNSKHYPNHQGNLLRPGSHQSHWRSLLTVRRTRWPAGIGHYTAANYLNFLEISLDLQSCFLLWLKLTLFRTVPAPCRKHILAHKPLLKRYTALSAETIPAMSSQTH